MNQRFMENNKKNSKNLEKNRNLLIINKIDLLKNLENWKILRIFTM
jgi:hypothetical protein